LRPPLPGRTFDAVMTSIDTLEIAKRLRSAGFDDRQAEAVTGVLRDATYTMPTCRVLPRKRTSRPFAPKSPPSAPM